MAGGDFILAGLMSGLGKGQEMTYLQNRQDALENLRNQRGIEAEGRADQRAQTTAATKFENDKELAGITNSYKIDQLNAAGQVTQETNKQKFGQEVQLVGIKGSEDRKSAGFKEQMERETSVMLENLKGKNDRDSIALRNALEGGHITDRTTDTNGRVILIRNDGKMITTPYTEREKVDTSNPYGSKKDKPGPTPGDFDPNAEPAESARPRGDGKTWYQGGKGGGEPVKVATLAQVREAAKTKGWTEADTRRWMQQNGWSIE